MAAEGKPRANLMASACGAKEAFVKKELFRNIPVETRLRMHLGLESSKGPAGGLCFEPALCEVGRHVPRGRIRKPPLIP
jgi:hypothetical protein